MAEVEQRVVQHPDCVVEHPMLVECHQANIECQRLRSDSCSLLCKPGASEAGVHLDTLAHLFWHFAVAKQTLAGVETLAVTRHPIGVNRKFVEQSVFVNPRLDKQTALRLADIE